MVISKSINPLMFLEGLWNLRRGVAYPILEESDSIEVVKLFRREEEDLNDIDWIINEILSLKNSCGVSCFG